ncbi:MAG: ZIP family metal transporter [Lachnospiraceae bacterium]|nr:ZIP family metal transporter [Lachnospiraceae bacterium]
MINGAVLQGILIPFLGTALGAGLVLFMRNELNPILQRALTGFAAGVMVAASIWSLLIPAMDQSAGLGKFAFVPAVIGFMAGIFLLLLLDHVIPHMHMNSEETEGIHTNWSKNIMLVLAVTLHNIPEGMAVGIVYAGWISGNEKISAMGALALALGIAIQNFPEGAIISMPLHQQGLSKGKALLYGVLSGAVEPLGAIAMIVLSRWIGPLLPVFLSFAAGAMIYVVVEELIPEMSEGKHSNIGTIVFALGFCLMMTLDVALG